MMNRTYVVNYFLVSIPFRTCVKIVVLLLICRIIFYDCNMSSIRNLNKKFKQANFEIEPAGIINEICRFYSISKFWVFFILVAYLYIGWMYLYEFVCRTEANLN